MTASTLNVSASAPDAMLHVHPTERKAFAMKTQHGLRLRGLIRCALIPAILAAALSSMPVTAQQTRVQQAQRKVTDLIALYDAEDHKSPLCKGYIGKVVTPSSFSALALRLTPPAAKGEFETTAQYNARVAASRSAPPTAPVVLALPTDRDFISYDADTSLMLIQAGAFGAGRFSDDAGV